MSTINDGGPAFPVGSGDMRDPVGMTLRDYFAAKAMQSLLTSSRMKHWRTGVAMDAYMMADAMLAARKEKP